MKEAACYAAVGVRLVEYSCGTARLQCVRRSDFTLGMLAFIGAAAADSWPPPPPPSPPPLLPLEVGEAACQDLSLPKGQHAVFSVFGGSNTQGANAMALNAHGGTMYGRGIPSFAHLLACPLVASSVHTCARERPLRCSQHKA